MRFVVHLRDPKLLGGGRLPRDTLDHNPGLRIMKQFLHEMVVYHKMALYQDTFNGLSIISVFSIKKDRVQMFDLSLRLLHDPGAGSIGLNHSVRTRSGQWYRTRFLNVKDSIKKKYTCMII